MERQEVIEGLREMADFLERNNEVPVPRIGNTFNVFVTKDELQAVARSLGKAHKGEASDWFYLRKTFSGGLNIDFNVPREQVCTKRVVRTETVPEQVIPAHEREIVEWDCQPLLAEGR